VETNATVMITEVNVPYSVTSTLTDTKNGHVTHLTPGASMSVQITKQPEPFVLDITNDLTAVVPTGIFGNSVMPFVVLFVVMILGYVVYFVLKRRKK
ncbi:MAG: hypothetical protein II162_00190, partial [Clostridia bacterium]|nr:hypothetical protein [Clostridia bacterium]